MTAIMISQVLYVCDSATCGAEVVGHTGRLPDGWREWKREQFRNRFCELYIGHLCPKCVAPEGTK